MDNYYILDQLYECFGASSKEYAKVVADLCKTHSFHTTAKNTGIGYRTIKDIANIFDNKIVCNSRTEELDIEKDFSDLALREYDLCIPPFCSMRDQIGEIVDSFKSDKRDLDHISANIKCCYNRARDLITNYDVRHCRFLFLGDHDFTSVSLSILCAQIGVKPTIVVMDIDEDVLKHIKVFSNQRQLEIETYCCDFRYAVPESFKEYFDVIFTDPPYTSEGMDVFLTKASYLLKNSIFSSVIISYKCADQSYSLGLQVQRTINKNGFYIKELLKNYNSYEAAEALGFRSDLYVCALAKKKKNSTNTNGEQLVNIYTHGVFAVEKQKATLNNSFTIPGIDFKDVFYIGNDPNIKCEKLRMEQFINQRLSGLFHKTTNKKYIIDLRKCPLMYYRVLAICDFNSYYVVTDRSQSKRENEHGGLCSLIDDAYEKNTIVSNKEYTVYFMSQKGKSSALSGSVGKRASVRNYITEMFCSFLKKTKNESRSIIDSWKLSEISKASLFFLPNCVIDEVRNRVEAVVSFYENT